MSKDCATKSTPKSSATSREVALGHIDRLRREVFNVETERKLNSHPYVKSAEDNTLTLAQLRAFALEQYSIQRSDAISFARLAGHSDFLPPSSLVGLEVPIPPNSSSQESEEGTTKSLPELFQFLLGGEIYAAPLLIQFAKWLGLDESDLKSHATSALAQAYPSYWSHLALSGCRAAGAAACAVNFPAWGDMCRRVCSSLRKDGRLAAEIRPKSTSEEKTAATDSCSEGAEEGEENYLGFLDFFATPIDNLDEMAASIIADEGASYEDLVEPVRLLQEYEVMFWDACYQAK